MLEFIELEPSKSDVLVNWDGEIVDESWFSREAFRIGDTIITNTEVTQVSVVTILLIIIAVLVCVGISYRKRDKIQLEARRASEFVRRSTYKVRMSIKSKLGQPVGEEHVP